MRKLVAIIAVIGLVGALAAAPAGAGKKKKKTKKVHETFEAQALPFVNLAATGTERRSCFAGVEDVHWVAQDFKSPGKGSLRAYMEGFTGDWDLAIELADGLLIYSLGDQIAQSPPEEEVVVPLTKGDEIRILACNYLGEPGPVQVHYEGKFKV